MKKIYFYLVFLLLQPYHILHYSKRRNDWPDCTSARNYAQFISICLIIMLSVVLYPIQTYAQVINFRVDKFTVEQGLSQNQVFCIYQDNKGFLWFGTQNGLNLYDGYNFKIFRHEPGNENSLLDYAVNSICETDTGIFWIGTREGMSRLDFKTGKFKHFRHHPDSANSLVDNNVWLIMEDSKKNLWISTRNGLSKYSPNENRFENFIADPLNPNTISNNFVFALAEDK